MEKKLYQKISLLEKLAYGFGDMGCNLITVLSTSFIMFFYTDSLGLSAAIIGSIIMFSKILDGISDILVGFIVDRTKSKHGRSRVWILRISIPISISLILSFTVPENMGVFTYIYIAVTYNLVNTVFYTLMNVPYGTLNSLMSRDQDQRMVINTFRMTMAQCGAMITSMLTIPLVNLLGGTSNKKSWIYVACIYAIIASIMFLFCFFKTKERVAPPVVNDTHPKISLFKTFICAFSNRYWVLLLLANTMLIMLVATTGASSTYYAKYILNNENLVGIITALSFAPALVLIPMLPLISKVIGKRNIALLGSLISLAGQLLLLINPLSYSWLLICSLIKGIGSVMIMGTIFAMIADTIEYGEWKTGTRLEGVLYAAASFGTKVGAGLGAAIAMGIIGSAGYDGSLAVQSAASLTAIKNAFLYAPIIMLTIIPILFALYKLDSIYPQVIKDLLEKENKYA